jgi:hypothetical protein
MGHGKRSVPLRITPANQATLWNYTVDEVHHSVELDLTYQVSDSPEGMVLVFEDGVAYTLVDALRISHEELSPVDIRALHKIKKTFDGELQPGYTMLGFVGPKVDLPTPKPLKRLEQAPAASGVEILTLDLGINTLNAGQRVQRMKRGIPRLSMQ